MVVKLELVMPACGLTWQAVTGDPIYIIDLDHIGSRVREFESNYDVARNKGEFALGQTLSYAFLLLTPFA